MTTQPDPARAAVTDDGPGIPENPDYCPTARQLTTWRMTAEGCVRRDQCPDMALFLIRVIDALAASEARLTEVERENARLALIEAEVRSIVADINDGKADSYWVRLAQIAMPDLGFPSWNDLHPAARSAGEGAE